MKKEMMIIPICVLLYFLSGCTSNENDQPQQSSPKTNKSSSVPSAVKTKKAIPIPAKHIISAQNIRFDGTYSVTLQGTLMVITLLSKGAQVSGNFLMNGQQAKINGTIKNQQCTGKIVEDETGKTYNFEADRKGEYLNFSFTIPEQNNQVVKLLMKKESPSTLGTSTTVGSTQKNKNPLLVGTWRYTEVISSGSGQFYSSFATDYFVKFNSNGSAQIWTGKSAGGTNSVTIDSAKPGSVEQAEWFTEGKLLYFVDPNTRAKSSISYYAEPNRMMLTKGNSKKVYQKIQ